jgi:hypothetical protein
VPGPPGPAEHEVVQGVAAVLAGGVDVAADVEAVLGDVVAGQAAGYLLLGFQPRWTGRPGPYACNVDLAPRVSQETTLYPDGACRFGPCGSHNHIVQLRGQGTEGA